MGDSVLVRSKVSNSSQWGVGDSIVKHRISPVLWDFDNISPTRLSLASQMASHTLYED